MAKKAAKKATKKTTKKTAKRAPKAETEQTVDETVETTEAAPQLEESEVTPDEAANAEEITAAQANGEEDPPEDNKEEIENESTEQDDEEFEYQEEGLKMLTFEANGMRILLPLRSVGHIESNFIKTTRKRVYMNPKNVEVEAVPEGALVCLIGGTGRITVPALAIELVEFNESGGWVKNDGCHIQFQQLEQFVDSLDEAMDWING